MDNGTAFLMGLVGSLHCLGMCGPLALALPGGEGGMGVGFLAGRLFYNLGRVTTYGFLGLFFGLIGGTLVFAGAQQGLSIFLGVVILAGLWLHRRLPLGRTVNRMVAGLKHALARHLAGARWSSMWMVGMLNGFLPCGLVYVACAGAAASGSAFAGTQYMVCFGLGTFPAMMAIAASGHCVQNSMRLRFQRAIPIAVVGLGVLFILRGLSLGIPYISPDLSGAAAHAPRCH